MRKLLAALTAFALLCVPAHAQKTKSALTTEIGTSLPDNSVGQITPSILRSTLIDMVNSWYGLIDATNAGTGQSTFATIKQTGASSGAITFQTQAAAGTYNWNWPTTAGTAGQVLTSAAGGASPMTWTTPGSQMGQPGIITVYWNGSAWIAQKPDGTFIATGSTVTCGFQEAVNYAITLNYPVFYYGRGQQNPCVITAASISVPAGNYMSYYLFNAVFQFNNTSQNGIIFDSQIFGLWDCSGCTIEYQGTGTAYLGQPLHNPNNTPGGSSPCVSFQCSLQESTFKLGTVVNAPGGGTPNAMLELNISSINGVDQQSSSSIANNTFIINGLSDSANTTYGIQVPNATNAFQVFGENQINFNIIGGPVSGISIGTGSGTNIWTGSIAITGSGTRIGIQSSGIADVFNLTSVNCYQSSISQINFTWNSTAAANVVYTPQILACGGGIFNDASTLKTNNVILQPSSLPLPRTVAGLPTCIAALEGWEYVVTNNNTAAAWNAAVTTGGTTVSTVKCDGSSWKQF